jgi:hypothetical protein
VPACLLLLVLLALLLLALLLASLGLVLLIWQADQRIAAQLLILIRLQNNTKNRLRGGLVQSKLSFACMQANHIYGHAVC